MTSSQRMARCVSVTRLFGCCWALLLLLPLPLAGAGEALERSDPDAPGGLERACLAQVLSLVPAEALALEPKDAYAIMDAQSGRILAHHNPILLAQASVQPGSVFKLVTSYVALSENLVDPDAWMDCRGGDRTQGPAGHEVRCWYRPGHGPVNLSKALALSCNLYFAGLGERLGSHRLLDGARLFGLGRRTESDLPGEVPGRLPGAGQDVESARMGTGQANALEITPLQALVMAGALANGGALMRPMLASPHAGSTGVVGVLPDSEAIRFLRQAMCQASQFGTGADQHLAEHGLCGKTGTSAWAQGFRTHAWYLGFAPQVGPRVALVVFIHQGIGSKDAAGLAGALMGWLRTAEALCWPLAPAG